MDVLTGLVTCQFAEQVAPDFETVGIGVPPREQTDCGVEAVLREN